MGEASGPLDVHWKVVGRGQVLPESPPFPLSKPVPESAGLGVPELEPELVPELEPELAPELDAAPELLEEPEDALPLVDAEGPDPELEPTPEGGSEPASASVVVDPPAFEEAHAPTSIAPAVASKRRGGEVRTVSAVAAGSQFRHATRRRARPSNFVTDCAACRHCVVDEARRPSPSPLADGRLLRPGSLRIV